MGKVIIDEVNLDVLKSELESIGWKIDGCDEINQYIHDENGKQTDIYVLSDRVTIENRRLGSNFNVSFYFSGCKIIKWVEDNQMKTIALGTKECFLMMHNFKPDGFEKTECVGKF